MSVSGWPFTLATNMPGSIPASSAGDSGRTAVTGPPWKGTDPQAARLVAP